MPEVAQRQTPTHILIIQCLLSFVNQTSDNFSWPFQLTLAMMKVLVILAMVTFIGHLRHDHKK